MPDPAAELTTLSERAAVLVTSNLLLTLVLIDGREVTVPLKAVAALAGVEPDEINGVKPRVLWLTDRESTASHHNEASNSEAQGTSDLLLPFEFVALPESLREFVRATRNNQFATIQAFPVHWEYFKVLDSVMIRLQEDMKVTKPNHQVPLMLMLSAWFRYRLAAPLAFAGCVSESASLARDVVEYFVHAFAMIDNPELAAIWLSRDDGKKARKRYAEVFEDSKRSRLFARHPVLYDHWRFYSDIGSHANVKALSLRARFDDSDPMWFRTNVECFEIAPDRLKLTIEHFLHLGAAVEQSSYERFEGRLSLDPDLVSLRSRLRMLGDRLDATRAK